jgi:hypothetical protein
MDFDIYRLSIGFKSIGFIGEFGVFGLWFKTDARRIV